MRLLAQTVFTVSISDKERLGTNQSAEIRIEVQHCVPLRMNPNFSDAAFHIRSFQDFVLYVKVNVVNKVQGQVFRDPIQHVNISLLKCAF